MGKGGRYDLDFVFSITLLLVLTGFAAWENCVEVLARVLGKTFAHFGTDLEPYLILNSNWGMFFSGFANGSSMWSLNPTFKIPPKEKGGWIWSCDWNLFKIFYNSILACKWFPTNFLLLTLSLINTAFTVLSQPWLLSLSLLTLIHFKVFILNQYIAKLVSKKLYQSQAKVIHLFHIDSNTNNLDFFHG